MANNNTTLYIGAAIVAWQMGLLKSLGIPAPDQPWFGLIKGATKDPTLPNPATPQNPAPAVSTLPDPATIRKWASSIVLAGCMGFEFVEGYSRLPANIPEYQGWADRTGRRGGECKGPGSGIKDGPNPMKCAYPESSTKAPY